MNRLMLLLFLVFSWLVVLLVAGRTTAAPAELPPYVATTTLVPDPVQANDDFGATLALSADGMLLAVGAPHRDVGGRDNQGAVFLFRRSGNVWSLAQTLTADDGQAGDRFGASLALAGPSDNVLLVGAPDADGGAHTALGTAYLFTKAGGGSWSQQARLDATEPDAFSYDHRGQGVGLSDDGAFAFVGAPGVEGPGGTTPGAVYVFAASSSWSMVATIDGPTASAAAIGKAIAARGNSGAVRLAVAGLYSTGSPLINRGIVRIYEGSGASWTLEDSLIPSNSEENDEFGLALALDNTGGRLLVGAPRNAGNAYLFTHNGSTWNEAAHFTPPGLYGQLGTGVALSGNGAIAAVGAPLNGSGVIYLYESSGASWTLARTLRAPGAVSGARFGTAVVITPAGDWLAGGAPEAVLTSAPAIRQPAAAGGALYVAVPGEAAFLPLVTR